MADLVFRKGGYEVSGGNAFWLGQSNASTLARIEFFGASAVFGYIKYWTGSAWSAKPIKYWTGTAWVQKPLKFWNGTTWRLTEYPI